MININYKWDLDIYSSKEELYRSFFGSFYDFILTKDTKVMSDHNIKNKEDFLHFCLDWFAEGKDSLYAMGFAFHPYFLMKTESLDINDQDEDHFIGWCYKHGYYRQFIDFLINWFAYWRNDEGCTCMDPYNHADKFFVSSWAALVDTGKMFYFDSSTVYFWQSYRVKYILDHIPGVLLKPVTLPKQMREPFELPDLKVAGYTFLGYFLDEEGTQPIRKVTQDVTVYPKFEAHDKYDYWEKEEKKIKKVYMEPYTHCDPA